MSAGIWQPTNVDPHLQNTCCWAVLAAADASCIAVSFIPPSFCLCFTVSCCCCSASAVWPVLAMLPLLFLLRLLLWLLSPVPTRPLSSALARPPLPLDMLVALSWKAEKPLLPEVP